MAGGVAQGVGPEFKPHTGKKKKIVIELRYGSSGRATALSLETPLLPKKIPLTCKCSLMLG
jgi:hypothetical protein